MNHVHTNNNEAASTGSRLSRRGLLTGGLGLGAAGLLASRGSASASSDSDPLKGSDAGL